MARRPSAISDFKIFILFSRPFERKRDGSYPILQACKVTCRESIVRTLKSGCLPLGLRKQAEPALRSASDAAHLIREILDYRLALFARAFWKHHHAYDVVANGNDRL